MPLISTYWRPEGTEVPQYHLIYYSGQKWHSTQVGRRKTPFSLSGVGTKYLPISRPLVLADADNRVYIVFRDVERANRVSLAVSRDPERKAWDILDLTENALGEWEPTCDTVLWQRKNILHLFVQNVTQKDRDVLDDIPPQMVSVLEWSPR
jgi:hypothetical protein